jgi:hypothetical protein
VSWKLGLQLITDPDMELTIPESTAGWCTGNPTNSKQFRVVSRYGMPSSACTTLERGPTKADGAIATNRIFCSRLLFIE